MKHSKIYFFLLFTLAAIIVKAQSSTPEEIDQLINQTIERNQYREVINLDTSVLYEAIQLSETQQYWVGYVEANLLLGEYFNRYDQALRAIPFLQLALEVATQKEFYIAQIRARNRMGHCYIFLGRMKEAVDSYTLLLEDIPSVLKRAVNDQEKNKLLELKSISATHLGIAQTVLGKTEEGLIHLLAAFEGHVPEIYENEIVYKHRESNFNSNIGYNYLITGNAAKARPYIEAFHDFLLEYGEDQKDLAQSFGNLAYCEYLLQNYDKAYEYYKKSLSVSIENGYPEVTSITYKDLSDTYRADGQVANAILYLDKHYALKDSLKGVAVQEDLNALKIAHETELKEQEIIRLKQQNQINRQQLLLFGVLGVFAIGFLILRNQGRKEKAEQAAQLQALKLANAEQELEYKKGDITRMALEISKKHDFAEQLLLQLNEFEPNVQKSAQKEWRAFEHRIRDRLQNNEEQQVFQENIEQINQAFYAKLSAAFPELNASEKDLCSYIRLGLSKKEISVLRGVTPGAIRMAQLRLRKKLNLEDQQDVEAFLKTI